MNTSYQNKKSDAEYKKILESPALFPFRFNYAGETFSGFPKDSFTLTERKTVTETTDKITTDLTFKKDENLYITARLTHYSFFGVTEWTLWFENRGTTDTSIISDAETVLHFEGKYPMLKGILGDHVNKYRPYSLDVSDGHKYFESNSSRATHVYFPYFNLEYGDGGAMLAIGWAGTWRANFSYDEKTNVTEYRARSVNNLKARLKPGEKIRTALFVLAPYTVRSEDYATNFWRNWFIDCNLPPADDKGTKLSPFSTAFLAYDTGRPNSDGSISEGYDTWRPSMEKMIEEDVKTDFRWVDAGWYVAPDGSSPETDWWGTIGTWELDRKKWPGNTFRESTDFARENGMKTLMWFEPERVTDPDSLSKKWGYDKKWAIKVEGDKAISNNIGDEGCYRWTVDRIIKTLRENRVEMYREDNNSDQGKLWRHLDAAEGEGRSGITECKFIDAHYRMWDEFIACTLSYGGCGFVDSCASGGGRNDLESLRRGIPLLRSDYDRTTTALRLSMTTAFNKWVPVCGANIKEKPDMLSPTGLLDKYIWRASYLPVLNIDSQYVQEPKPDFDLLRFGMKEWKRVSPYFLKDYYVLTPWHPETERTGFTAYAFYDPDEKAGVLLAFRQEKCDEETLTLSLPFAGDFCTVSLTDEDSGEVTTLEGLTAKKGFELTFNSRREARLLWIKG